MYVFNNILFKYNQNNKKCMKGNPTNSELL